MGIAALKFTEGKYSSNMMKLILLTALAAVALAEPEPHYGYYGYPYYHQLGWPSVRAPGFSSTCWGCRGKRSAEPSPFYGHFYPYAHAIAHPALPAVVDNVNQVSGPFPHAAYTAAWPGASVSNSHGKKKRSADAEPEADAEADADADAYYGYYGYGGHGYALPGHSYAHFGYGYPYHHYGKRSAEPEPHYGYYGYPYGYYGYPYYHHAIAHPALKVVGGAGVHPGGATSSVSRSPQGLRGKRSAEVDNVNRVSGASPFPSYTAAWPGATVSVDHGNRKRSAGPHGYFGYYGHPFYYHPYAYFHGPAAKPAAIDGDAYTAEWPGATVSVDHIAKRSAELVDNVNQVSGSSSFPSYSAAWPGATVSVDHGK